MSVKQPKQGSWPTGGVALGAALLATGAALLAGCLSPEERSRARAELSGPNGLPVRVVTSTRFDAATVRTGPGAPDTTGVALRSADTVVVELPGTVEQDISSTGRFLVEVTGTKETFEQAGSGPINVQMDVFIDGEQRANSSGDLRETFLRFIFQSFNP